MADQLIIDEGNWQEHAGDNAGGICGTFPRIAPEGSLPFAAAPTFPLIPRAEWRDRISDMRRTKSLLSDILKDSGIHSLNQQQTSFCHANSPAMALMALRAVENQPFVLLSPASIAGPVTGFRNEGAFIADDLAQIVKGGCASQAFVPPNQVARSGFKEGWEQDALKHRVDQWWDLGHRHTGIFDQVMTLLLSRIPVCTAHNWWGHAVTALNPWFDANGFGTEDINSWGEDYPTQGAGGYFILREGKGTPDEAYAPFSTTFAG